MNNLKVVIDAGHGGDDPGAVSNGVDEKDLTLTISKYMYDKFKEKGIPVVLVRNTDETLSPEERVQRILNAYGDNKNVIIISNHINSSSSSNAEGAEVIYALRNNDTLAKNVLEALTNDGQIGRKYYQRRLPSDTSKDYYFIHRLTGTKTQPIIIEYGFISNSNDLKKIQNNYKTYVNNIVNAVIQTINGTNTYTVKKGDTLWSIARNNNTTVDTIKSLNNLSNNNLSIGQVLKLPTSNTGSNTYTVQKGDTLWNIAKKYNTTVNEIKSLNNLTNNSLSIGQILKLPTSNNYINYTVKAGDSLWNISRTYNTTVDAIKALNNLSSNSLSIGQILKIPK